jgi:hypothetical protein
MTSGNFQTGSDFAGLFRQKISGAIAPAVRFTYGQQPYSKEYEGD